MRSLSCENDFDLHENETACRTHFHMKGFALRLVLKQRDKRTRKWPIGCMINGRNDKFEFQSWPEKYKLCLHFFLSENSMKIILVLTNYANDDASTIYQSLAVTPP